MANMDAPSAIKEMDNFKVAVDATISSLKPLLDKTRTSDESLQISSGLSVLLLRPQLLLASVHHLVLLTALRLTGHDTESEESSASFNHVAAVRSAITSPSAAPSSLVENLRVNQEVMDKVRGMESKLSYQIKKLSALAQAEEARGQAVIEDAAEDPLAFRPNLAGLSSGDNRAASSSRHQKDGDVYRPPRVAAMPYNEPGRKARRDRRAPALLDEFASTMDGTPLLESTSGLATRPVQLNRHTNSLSAKRAKELKEISDYEQANMTRLSTTKREAKRRREDEEALAMGHGISDRPKGRRGKVNGLEAELEGVLGSRGSKGVWAGVSDLSQRGDVFERGKRAKVLEMGTDSGQRMKKKTRFEKDLAGAGRRKKSSSLTQR